MKNARVPGAQAHPRDRKRQDGNPVEGSVLPDRDVEVRRRDRTRMGLLFLLAFFVYNANLRPISAGDTYPARFLPFSLWGRASLTLDSVREVARVGRVRPYSLPYWMMTSPQGWIVSSYPLVTPVLVAPLYGPAVGVLHLTGWNRDVLAAAGAIMEKVSASVLAAVSVGLVYLLLRRRLDSRLSTLLALAYAFGTNTWVTSSQALWQHGTTQVLSLVSLLALTGERGRLRLALGGAACGLIPFNRPPDFFLALGIGVAALLLERKRAWPFVVAAVVAAAPFAALNWLFFHHVGGGYFRMPGIGGFFSGSIPVGIAGLLLSPGKGLFVFSPFLIFLLGRIWWRAPEDGHGLLDTCLAGGVLLTLLLLAAGDFRGGFSYGPRFLTGILPVLVWLLAPVLRRIAPGGRRAFAAAVLAGVAIQAVGAFCYPHGSSDTGSVWKLGDAPFLVEPRAGLAPPELLLPQPPR
ncbi:MAG: hypothetical protein HY900_34800 [Deltaproteobacteria bacterium]|nr:hypothetical protein [Deltaproteobacteria bacterium]